MADPRFATRLLLARRRSGMTQAVLAARCGLTGPYISLLETARKPPPSDDVVRRLAGVLGEDADDLLATAHLDRAPEDLRKSMQRLRRQADQERERRLRTTEALLPISLWGLGTGGSPPASLPGTPGSRRAAPPEDGGILEAITRLFRDAGEAPDPRAARERARQALLDLPPADRARFLERAADLVPAGDGWIESPPDGMPPAVFPGDRLRLDPGVEPSAGDLVIGTVGGVSRLAVFGDDVPFDAVPTVVVELRRRLRAGRRR